MTQDHSRPDPIKLDTQSSAIEIGKQLTAARQATDQSIADTAQQLCITSSALTLLESGQWEKAGPAVYVRGYLMSCCRLLNIDPAEIIAYFRQQQANQVIEDESDQARPQHRPGLARYQHLFAYAVASLLIGPALIFWVAQGFRGNHTQPDPGQVQATAIVPTAYTEQAVLAEVSNEQQEPVMASMATVPANLPQTNTQSEAEIESTRDEAPGMLEMAFAEEAWLEVSDSHGKRLEYGLVPANSERRFSITSGLSIRLGNADSVVASIDGQQFDLLPYVDQDIANFDLPLPLIDITNDTLEQD